MTAEPQGLVIEHLNVDYNGQYRQVSAVKDVSFSVAPGEIFGLAGESGCGKSTIANAVMRLLDTTAEVRAGRLAFDGVDLLGLEGEQLREFRWRQIAMVFQSAMNALNPVMTIGAQIVDVLKAHEKISTADATERAAELLTLVGIDTARLGSYPHQLSGGMRQRCVIAISLALNPRLLIMDEPTTALDVVVQQDIMQQITELQRALKFSVLFITHDISLMIEISHRMAVMYGGRLVELGDPSTLLDNPQHPYTSALMGAFPPLTGPRRHVVGLSEDGVRPAWAKNIGQLELVGADHWVAAGAEGGKS